MGVSAIKSTITTSILTICSSGLSHDYKREGFIEDVFAEGVLLGNLGHSRGPIGGLYLP